MNAIANKITDKQRIAALRDYAKRHYGQRRMRVVASGEIHVYSRMPNSNEWGWWLAGQDAQRACERFFGPDSHFA